MITARHLRRHLVPAAALGAAFIAAALPAQDAPALPRAEYVHDRDAPRVRAVRASGPIVLDGQLDEAAWSAAPSATGFTQTDPREGEPPSQRTEVRVLYDDSYLYVGARMWDTGEVRTRLGRRDAFLANSDQFSVMLDSYHDHLTSFTFSVNPSGVRRDVAGFDTGWDPVWEVATSIDSEGWTAELRIPFSQLRFGQDGVQVWGIQFARTIARTEERMVFAFTPRSERGGVARYGHLMGLEGIRPGRRAEILPYVTTRAEYRDIPAANPFRTGSDYFTDAGVDVKYRLTSNLTLDAAINPDFGQVEVDPAVINLSAFETFFQERRPFFVEGAEIFGFGTAGDFICYGCTQLFYSRRIGRAPQAFIPGALFTDAPDASRILGATKLTGKSPGGWSMGALNAVTARESARWIDGDGVIHSTPVEPLTNHFAGRLRRDMRGGRSTVGAMLTAVNRALETEAFENRFRSSAYAGGIDMRHELAQRRWALTGFVSASHINGSPAVIRAAQRSSARYFQRPDAAHLSLDTLATALAGYDAQLSLRRQAGQHWRGGVELSATSPGYEINDLGFLTGADRMGGNANIFYMQNRPGKTFRNWSAGAFSSVRWNYGGDLVSGNLGLNASGQLQNFWGGGVYLSQSVPSYSDRLTWGGPLARSPASSSLSLNASSDSRKRISGSAFGGFSRNTAGGGGASLRTGVSFRPAPTWNVSLSPSYSRNRSIAQHVTSVADPAAVATFGRRYVFAELDQTTWALGTRLNLTFRPDMTLELFAQPFLATGRYSRLKEFRAPGTYDFLIYGQDAGSIVRDPQGFYRIDPTGEDPETGFRVPDPDFTMRSLRGNAVMRWEWRRGSTLFLVWQQRRGDYLSYFGTPGTRVPGELALPDDALSLFGLRPDHVFALKVNYWLNR